MSALTTFVHHWRQRHQTAALLLTIDEAAFSPPALAIEEKPVSPTLRLTAGVLMTLVTALMVWAVFARVDIVAKATGKVIPTGFTKTIASVDTASVRAILVHDGQAVKAGDPLLLLDATQYETDRDKASGDELVARLQVARSRALIAAVQSGQAPVLSKISGVPAQVLHEEQLHLKGEYLDFSAQLSKIDGDVERYTQALPVARQRESIDETLLKNHDVATDTWLQRKQERLDLEGQLEAARNARQALIAQTERQAYDTLADADKTASGSAQDVIRAGSHARQLTLTAPVDGTVQQLAVHTVGGVVQAAQPLMQIVPAQDHVEVEATLENKDVGFVAEQQPAQVKVEAFDYTRYGTVPGRVVMVSRDATEDKDKGLVYTVRVRLDKSTLMVQQRELPLSAGMTVDVEIKTGTRRIIEYVLSPLLRDRHESFSER
jgi:hemolysin D